MVAAVQSSLRLCVRACGRAPAPRRIAAATLAAAPRRTFTSTRAWRSDDAEKPPAPAGGAATPDAAAAAQPKANAPKNTTGRSDTVVLGLQEGMSEEEKQKYVELLQYADATGMGKRRREFNAADVKKMSQALDELDDGKGMTKELETALAEFDKSTEKLDRMINEYNRPVFLHSSSFWGEEEEDSDLISETIDDDELPQDEIMSLGHGKLEEHREFREYARIAAWQMPLLSKLARPFEPPTAEECLRFRYTTYMGESHPAESKVVVEFSPADLPLDEAQQLKLRKLLGTRWNPETDVAKMSCEQFDQQAQNKRYLADLVQKLITAAKDPKDMFEDVPLDTRHHTVKVKPKFPKEWRMTPERMQELEDSRQKSLLLDQRRAEAGSLIDGAQMIETRFRQAEPAPVAELVRRGAPRSLPRQTRA